MSRVAGFFFMHIGSFVAVFTYVYLGESARWSPEAVAHALPIALAVMSTYVVLAWSQGEVKQFDIGLLTMFALGTLLVRAGVGPAVTLFQRYFGGVLFVTLGLTALVPLLLGRETFTYYFARRQMPRWQLKLPEFGAVNRVMTGYWSLLFFTASALASAAPTDWRFTLLYPNLLIFGLGMTATVWLPPLYFRLFPASLPRDAEPLIMGMPLVFDRKAAGDARATIQFRVTGTEPGDYHLRIARGKCVSFEGVAPTADLTVYTPGEVWTRIVRGELDGGRALAEGLYRAEGDFVLLAKIGDWFPSRQGS